LGNFFRSKSCAFTLTKDGLGNILGDFLTNASGRPANETDVRVPKLIRENQVGTALIVKLEPALPGGIFSNQKCQFG
jgi:hypothetical protein